MKFESNYRIGVEDIGVGNLATTKTIMTIREDIGSLHSASVGYGVKEIPVNKAAWAVLDWKIQVIRRPDYDEEIKAVTWSRKADKLFAYRDFRLYDKNDEIVAIGTSRWIYMDLEKRRPMRIMPEFVEKYQSEDESVFDEEINKISLEDVDLESPLSTFEYRLKRRDMDYNGHMHNISYIDIANEILPEKDYYSRHFDYVRVEYKKEILKDTDVHVKLYQKETGFVVIFETEDKVNAVIEYK